MIEKFERIYVKIASKKTYKDILKTLPKPNGGYSLLASKDPRIERLPHSLKTPMEVATQNCENFAVTKHNIDWENTSPQQVKIPSRPAHVILKDFTGVPNLVDLDSMEEAMKNLGNDPNKMNPISLLSL